MGMTRIANSLTVNALIVLLAGTIAAFLVMRPGWQQAQRYVMGSVLAALAIRMVLQGKS